MTIISLPYNLQLSYSTYNISSFNINQINSALYSKMPAFWKGACIKF